ncbi:MAG: hypothetical protein ACOH2R_11285 [Pseudomonas sp.]
MGKNRPPGSPPFDPKPKANGHRPARRDSPQKPGAPAGPQLPTASPDSDDNASQEAAIKYIQYFPGEAVEEHRLLPLICEHLPAPELYKLDPQWVSLRLAKEGILLLIPGSAALKPGDTFNLLWGGVSFPAHTLDAEILTHSFIGCQRVLHSPTSFLQQGKVKVCYDICRSGQRIGTSAVLTVNLYDLPPPDAAQTVRRPYTPRKHNRR